MNKNGDKGFMQLMNQKGFTLIEMAIVLIIIGIIIGAVVKGKDIIRGAEQKKIYAKFANGWQLAYSNFYDRTGKRLGDFHDGTALGQDGQCDTDTSPGSGYDYSELVTSSTPTSYYGLSQIGLDQPVTNASNSWQYDYTDSCGNTHNMTIAFDWNSTDNYNYMMIETIPSELAIALDTMIDGEADGTSGDFLRVDASDNAIAWGTDPCTAETEGAQWKMNF